MKYYTPNQIIIFSLLGWISGITLHFIAMLEISPIYLNPSVTNIIHLATTVNLILGLIIASIKEYEIKEVLKNETK